MKALFLTNEYPPHIYGGAGVHVQYLSRELAHLMAVDVRCFGDQNTPGGNPSVAGYRWYPEGYTCPAPLRPVFGSVQRCLDFNTTNVDADVVHCHTWYSHFGGILAKLNYGIPLVVTVHSLEPLRPWKREQLGGGYDFTCWLEKTALEMADAVIAVSNETKCDVEKLFAVDPAKMHIIYNGIDPEEYHPVESQAALKRHGINPHEPYILFVGRITRQKGIVHLVNAIKYMNPGFQIVLCAGAPDTPEIAAEYDESVGHRKTAAWLDLLFVFAGLGLLVLGSRFLVDGSISLARAWGISEAVIGLTIVAAGTSTPELAASIVAALKKEPDIAIGSIVGSNIYNLLCILGAAGLITPISSGGVAWVDMYVMLGISALLVPILWTNYLIKRWEGAVLLATYLGYLAWLWPK